MARCSFCGRESPVVSKIISACCLCVRERWDEVEPRVRGAHRESRLQFGLPEDHPRDAAGLPCVLCANECRIGPGELGFCGARRNQGGRLVGASTLLAPGYVEEDEVRGIAGFVAKISPDIPYSLLGFQPQFYMSDLPRTSRDHAQACLEAARSAGLKRVRIGNLHVLGPGY